MRRLVLGLVVAFSLACGRGVDVTDAGSTSDDAGVAVATDAGDEGVDAGPGCTPLSEAQLWKLKFIFVVERSAAMCLVDPPGFQNNDGFCEQVATSMNVSANVPHRVRALQDFMRAVSRRPEVSVALVPFETNISSVYPLDGPAARPDDRTLLSRISLLQTELGTHANLQSALEYVRAQVEGGVLRMLEAERSRTRFVVVVLSTGVPSPRCSRDDLMMPFASAARPELVWADSETILCNAIEPNLPPWEWINTFVPGTAINQNSQLLGVADQFKAMGGWYGVPEVKVHTRLIISASSLARCGALCDGRLPQGLNVGDLRTVGSYVMSSLASRSGGTFVDPGEPANLSLMDLASMEPTTFCTE